MLKKSNLNIAYSFICNNHKCCPTSPLISSMYFHVENFHLLACVTWKWFYQSSAFGLLSCKSDRPVASKVRVNRRSCFPERSPCKVKHTRIHLNEINFIRPGFLEQLMSAQVSSPTGLSSMYYSSTQQNKLVQLHSKTHINMKDFKFWLHL